MNDKIKINLQMAGATYPLTINREDEEIVRGSRQAGKYPDQCVSGTLSEHLFRENYSYGGLSICFGDSSIERP